MKLLYTILFALFISCSTEPEDCAGVAGGSAYLDECNVCGGDNSSCADCTGVVDGTAEEDMCGTCDDDPDNDCVQDCAGEWGGNLVLDECNVCGGDNLSCADNCGVPFGSNITCTGCIDEDAENYGNWLYECEDCCYYDSINYDVNDDGTINILDIANVVNKIINDIIPTENEDVIKDGIIDIRDATVILSLMIGRVGDSATIVHFSIEEDVTSITSDGWFGGIQMTLTHNTDFSINLTNNAMFADYVTNETTTTLVVILPENTDIFETAGNFEILSVKVGVDEYYIDNYIN